MSEILKERLQETDADGVAAFVFRHFHAAKLQAGSPQSFLLGHAAGDQVGGVGLDVEAHLFVHFTFHAAAAQHGGGPRAKAGPGVHSSSGVVCRIPAMTAVIWFQRSASDCRRRLPAAVSR